MIVARRQPEKIEQAQIVALLRSISGRVYTLGTHRRRGDYQGTMQTEGLPDLYAFLPRPPLRPAHPDYGPSPLWVEVKAAGGTLRPAQRDFRDWCLATRTPYVTGGVDAVIAFLLAGGWLKPDGVPHYRLPKGPTNGQDEATEKSHVHPDPAR